MADDAETLESKFQRLAAQYAKVKATNQVLKKAVKELQQQAPQQATAAPDAELASQVEALKKRLASSESRSKGAIALEAKARDLEQKWRNSAQEIDSLTFHNQQLSKRVEVLQEELESKRGSRSSKRQVTAKQQEALMLQEEELLRRIKENEGLHAQMAKHKATAEKAHAAFLKSQAARKADTGKLEAMLQAKAAENKAMTERMDNELSRLKEELSARENDVTASAAHVETMAKQLETLKQQHNAALGQQRRMFAQKVVFDDTRHSHWTSYNVPLKDPGTIDALRELYDEIATHVREFAASFVAVLGSLEQRSRQCTAEPGTETRKFWALLSRKAEVVTPVGKTCSQFRGGSCVLAEVAAACSSLATYLDELCISMYSATDEENQVPEYNATLRETNSAVVASFVDSSKSIAGIASVLVSACSLEPVVFSRDLDLLEGTPMEQFSGLLRSLHSSLRALSSQWSSKAALESRMLPARGTPDVLQTNTALTSALSKLVVCANSLMLGVVKLGAKGDPAAPLSQSIPPRIVEALGTRARSFMTLLHRDPPQSVPYADALLAVGSQKLSVASDASQKELQECRTTIAKLEEEKERYMLECQLKDIKLKKQASLQQQVPTAVQPDLPQSDDSIGNVETVAGDAAGSPTENGSAPAAAAALTVPVNDDQLGREDLIKQHFVGRLNHLTAQVQFADSKAVAYFEECRSMALRLELAQAAQKRISQELKGTKQRMQGLQEEVDDTKRNYEDQLAAMSEHVMRISEQLSSKQNVLDQLQSQAAAHQRQSGGSSRSKRR